MLENKNLRKLSLQEVQALLVKAEARRATLEKAKAKGGAGWTEAMQNELETIVLDMVDIQDAIAEKTAAPGGPAPAEVDFAGEEVPAKEEYKPEPGSEGCVHLRAFRGNRFDPKTARELVKPTRMILNRAEWINFKKYYASLGYTVTEILHDPFGDAKDVMAKEETGAEK